MHYTLVFSKAPIIQMTDALHTGIFKSSYHTNDWCITHWYFQKLLSYKWLMHYTLVFFKSSYHNVRVHKLKCLYIFSYFSMETYVVSTPWKHLEALLMSTHSIIMFISRNKKNNFLNTSTSLIYRHTQHNMLFVACYFGLILVEA